ncbi:LPXTG cell wall anchor domain-containing protein, partial [Bacillus atrophaeus]|nr:LPXTG cell wall anchor domain-containing protein [Bacillus atrophaeus]
KKAEAKEGEGQGPDDGAPVDTKPGTNQPPLNQPENTPADKENHHQSIPAVTEGVTGITESQTAPIGMTDGISALPIQNKTEKQPAAHKLPDTSAGHYNFIVIGTAMTLSGIYVYVRRKRSASSK